LNGSNSIKLFFLKGLEWKNECNGKIGAHGLYTLLHSLGFTVAMNTRTDKENIYTLHTCETFRTNPDAVKKIIALPDTNADDYVYDIETESGRFLGGVGRIILKNTDSCYINFSEYADKTKAKDLDSFCRQVESEISSLFPKPMKFAYEEQIYWRYLILTKKRYMALKCDLDGNVDNKIAKRGVLLSRRDNSKYIRDTYANTILKSFYREDLDVVLMKLFEDVKKLCVNALPVKDLVVTKGIGAIADYKIRPLHVDDKKCKKRLQELGLYHEEANMDVLRNIITAFGRKEDIEDESYLHNLEYLIFKEYVKLSLPAQIQLAERMRARGSHVSAGERLGYVITQNGDKLGEKMEDTDYFKEHAESLKIDYLYYMKLMINPFDEVLETVYGEKDLFKKFYKTREQFKKVMDQLQKLFMPRLRFVE
jgi:DNA polymerase elongation subunit (family B)